ncbi:hypothetical protein F5Y12DRAFT_717313 [Xylaria sp. FL1777]|nr:hypothetical protein F5Y12DRAFT_717313 [Xylaria sp. FL1777]
MSPIGDIVAVACLVIVTGALSGMALWMKMTDRWREWSHPQKVQVPKSIEDALKVLHTVSERRSQKDYLTARDDAECPICLASFSRKSEDTTNQQRDCDVDLEAGLGFARSIMTITAGVSRLTVPSKWKKRRPLQPIDDEILRIRRCGHAFHSNCLVTWFLKEKYECPICRARYYSAPKGKKKQQEEQVEAISSIPPPLIF